MVVISASRQMDVLWGFMAAVFAFALYRASTGDMSATARAVLVTLFAVLLVATVGTWIASRREPARLAITSETIEFRHGNLPNAITLRRTDGDLYVRRAGGRYPQRYLMVSGSDAAIPLLSFDWSKVRNACSEAGWRFVEDEP
jgi:hypothetical protein